MRAEYLCFNLVVLVPVALLSFYPPPFFVQHWRAAWTAVLGASVPFLVWDSLVAGRHWWWNPRFILGVRIAGLPIEEILFFFTVPFACLFSWYALFDGARDRPRGARGPSFLLLATIPLGAWFFMAQGREYTGLALGAFGAAVGMDLAFDTRLFDRAGFRKLLVLVVVLTTLFNGYLTTRPVVLYEERYQLGFRILNVPIEDYAYGLALVVLTGVLFQRGAPRAAARRSWIARKIEAQLGGYVHAHVTPDPSRPERVDRPMKIAVVGSGVAGLTAAAVLADRGFAVTVFERNGYLGGKVGSWPITLPDGAETHVSHGFHAFFRQYHNLTRLLRRLGAADQLVPIDDYCIIGRDGERLSFKETATTPILNLLSLAGKGFFRLRDALLNPKMQRLEAMLRYDPDRTFAELDDVSFARFADSIDLPPRLRLAFNTFSRAFFAEEDRMSTAELIKGFHFYYLSNDAGLLYDYLGDDYDRSLLQPARRYLDARGVLVRGERFERVVLAADVRATRSILTAPGSIAAESPAFVDRIERLRPSQRYAVLRLWLDRGLDTDLPVFVCTDRRVLLDAVAFVHRAEAESRAWVAEHGGGVYELHCYAVPDSITADADVRHHLIDEMGEVFPELRGARVVHEHLYVRDDFAAFHVGMAAHRPTVETPVEGLFLAGDWVKLPVPAMLMEAACVAGLLAANAILRGHGLREEAVWSVPPKGILTGLPERPRRP